MFFTKTARIIASLLAVFGVIRVLMGLLVANMEPQAAAAARYLGSKTAGEAIDQGFYVFVCGILIGVLTEISNSVANSKDKSD